ncbi:MAG: M20/M25/M40 family metallo-hydrolase [Henriciella sp.]|nr:M20/M25/M40 family metallo-hydrolase [Henriciella sp.]
MNYSTGLVLSTVLLAGACTPASEPADVANETTTAIATETTMPAANADLIEAHIRFLADDDLQGREAGTEGYDAAAAYVASQMEALGVLPAGDDGTYFQTVPLQRSYRNSDDLAFSVTRTDTGEALSFEENVDHVVFGSTRRAESAITAEAVFVGFGVVAPDLGRDDYAGLDVDGKIVVTLSGTPKGIQTEERAYYGSRKSAEASKRGAIGSVSLTTPTREQIYSFARLVGEGRLESASMGWLKPDGETYTLAPNLQAAAGLSLEGGRKLIESAGQDFDAIMEAADAEGGAVQGFALPHTISISQSSTLDVVESDNVIGLIEGSDPELKDEIIVLTAHLDHIGISQSFEDDKINNGALDNAAGVATLLEVARMMLEGERPRRSVMLLIVTAEEKGLLGAQYFAQNPTVDASRLVGNVNLDMPVLTYSFEDVVAFGSDRSTIESAVIAAAEDMNMALSPDPFPDQGLFTRSDHFRMVEIGVPAVFLATGMANGGDAAWAEHFAKNYHRPSDDLNNNLDFDAAARFAEVNARIALELANRDERPLWVKDDFFARQFNGPQVAE